MSGNVEYKFDDKIFIADVSGYAEKALMEGILEQFFEKLDDDFTAFVFNFEKMTLINSTALAVLLEIISEGIGNDDIRFYFCAIPNSCRLGMSGVGILKYIEEVASVEEAISKLKN